MPRLLFYRSEVRTLPQDIWDGIDDAALRCASQRLAPLRNATLSLQISASDTMPSGSVRPSFLGSPVSVPVANPIAQGEFNHESIQPDYPGDFPSFAISSLRARGSEAGERDSQRLRATDLSAQGPLR